MLLLGVCHPVIEARCRSTQRGLLRKPTLTQRPDLPALLQSTLEAVNRLAIHISLLVLYSLGGWLIANGYMSLKTLMAGIGFTFSLIFASQGVVNTMSEWRMVEASVARYPSPPLSPGPCRHGLRHNSPCNK